MQGLPLLHWYLVQSEFELGDGQDTWCVSGTGEELALELGCKAPRQGGSEVIQPAQLLALPPIVHPGRLHNLSGPPDAFSSLENENDNDPVYLTSCED